MPSSSRGGPGAVPKKMGRELHFLHEYECFRKRELLPERHRGMKPPGEWGVCMGDNDQD